METQIGTRGTLSLCVVVLLLLFALAIVSFLPSAIPWLRGLSFAFLRTLTYSVYKPIELTTLTS